MPISRPTMSAPRMVRRRKIENGMSGLLVRLSMATKAARSSSAIPPRTSVCVEHALALGVAALGKQARRDRRRRDADRHVDEQPPLPACVLGEHAAEQD